MKSISCVILLLKQSELTAERWIKPLQCKVLNSNAQSKECFIIKMLEAFEHVCKTE